MIQQPSTPKALQRTLIDTLGDAYRMANRQPWLVLPFLLLNLYMWFGAQISFAPLVDSLVTMFTELQPATAVDSATTVEGLRVFAQLDMRYQLDLLKTIPILPTTQFIGMAGSAEPIQVRTILGALAVFVLINLLSFPITAAVLVAMAEAARGVPLPASQLLLRMGRGLLSIIIAMLIVLAVGSALVLPFFVLSVVLAAINPAIGSFAMFLMMLAIIWIGIYLGFTNEAIVIGPMGPLDALRMSFTVVRKHFWGTIGLLILTGVIWNGCAALFSNVVNTPIGVAIALIGSAYIGFGVRMARLIFFQDRLQLVQADRKA
ncbi:MAG: hypothetical protein Fur005_11530 [Roseiflexaceae bacterium]